MSGLVGIVLDCRHASKLARFLEASAVNIATDVPASSIPVAAFEPGFANGWLIANPPGPAKAYKSGDTAKEGAATASQGAGRTATAA
jgi:hypothetical protein